jgi:hypothetical protein
MSLRADLLKLAGRIKARVWGAWGVEHDFISWLIEQKINSERAQSAPGLFRAYSDALGLRLVGYDDDRMVELSFQAVTNQLVGSGAL